jgi:hypothetical protein
LVNFFNKQLIQIQKEIVDQYELSRKWKLDIDKARKLIEQDPINPNFKKPIYTSLDTKEKVDENFKKMDFVMIIDISWSMDTFKWRRWALTIVTTILSQALMHLEKSIQNILEDPEYKIDLNFILYWDNIWYTTLWQNKFDINTLKLAKTYQENEI